ncbi:MAG TPA: hypothetical protein VE861_07325, partial [Gemmatimonadaceae bacterium]|nr:hypothetical protein [Gemmatimonadaceae bacterium]
VDTNLVWSSASGYGSVGGIVSRWDRRSNLSTQVEVWPQGTIGHAADEVKYRFVWTFPVHLSPHDHNTVYVGSQHVHKTTNGGRTWTPISPDLSRNDRSRMVRSGGLTPDNIGVEYSGVVFAIAESPVTKGVIWAGTNDAKLHVTRDAGATWTDLTANIPGLAFWGTISNIEPSRYDPAAAYISVDAHQANNRDPFIYKTSDYGRTWQLLVTGIPKSPLSYVHIVREDPVRRGLLYAGTENGAYVSFNDGALWQPLQNNLPHAPVYWITVQEHFSDLVIATYGRGFWILDDITPLRMLSPEITARPAHLFAPRPAYRFMSAEAPFADSDDPSQGVNPSYGASLHFWLREAGKDSVSFSITDAGGKVVRVFRAPAKAGMNRVWWNLRTDETRKVLLRADNPYSPETKYPPSGKESPSLGRFSALVPPGTYTVTLDAAGQTQGQRVEVRRDPQSGAADAEIVAQTAMVADVMTDLNASADMVNALEVARTQLATIRATLAPDSSLADLRASTDTMSAHLQAVEERLTQLRTTGRGQDLIRQPFRLGEQLVYLAGSLTASDYAPTDAHKEVHVVLRAELQKAKAAFDQVMTGELTAYKQQLRGRNVPGAIIF